MFPEKREEKYVNMHITGKSLKREIAKVVKKNYFTLNQVFLFGSRATGRFRKDSDWDLLIVINERIPLKERRELALSIYHHLRRTFPEGSFDVFVKSLADFKEESQIVNTVSYIACKDGLMLE